MGTEWSGSGIWLRRQFKLDAVPKYPWLMIYHDEDAEVYINGVLAAAVEGYTTDYIFEEISSEARKTLHEGTNTVAVHCKNTAGCQGIDVGLSNLIKPDEIAPQQDQGNPIHATAENP